MAPPPPFPFFSFGRKKNKKEPNFLANEPDKDYTAAWVHSQAGKGKGKLREATHGYEPPFDSDAFVGFNGRHPEPQWDVKDGIMKPVHGSRDRQAVRSTSMANEAYDGPSPEDYARWNNASPAGSLRSGRESEIPSVYKMNLPESRERQQSSTSTTLSAPSKDTGHPTQPQPHPDPFSRRSSVLGGPGPSFDPLSKLRRRTVSGPTPQTTTSITTSVKGEDPLKRMKYDLQVTTFLLNKLKSGLHNPDPHSTTNSKVERPASAFGYRPFDHNRTVDPKNLVDPWIDSRKHGSEFHQMHNHGLLYHPSHRPQPQPSVRFERSYSTDRPRTRTESQTSRSRSRTSSELPHSSSHGEHHKLRRTRHMSDVTPAVVHAPSTASSSSRDHQPQARDQDYPVFGNFRKQARKNRQSMPVIPAGLAPETIVPIDSGYDGGGGPEDYPAQQRKVRFRGADSVIGGSPPGQMPDFPSLPYKSGGRSHR